MSRTLSCVYSGLEVKTLRLREATGVSEYVWIFLFLCTTLVFVVSLVLSSPVPFVWDPHIYCSCAEGHEAMVCASVLSHSPALSTQWSDLLITTSSTCQWHMMCRGFTFCLFSEYWVLFKFIWFFLVFYLFQCLFVLLISIIAFPLSALLLSLPHPPPASCNN